MSRALVAAAALASFLAIAQAQQPPPTGARGPGASDPAAADKIADFRRQVQSDRRGVVERYLQLTPAEAKKFWPVYEDYQRKLEPVVSRQNRAINDFVASEASITDANAKRIAREILAAERDEQALREKHLRKVVTVLPVRKAVRYMQIENKIRALNRFDIAVVMPLVQ
jgi:Spy/CpxP family protein refolding chaperone